MFYDVGANVGFFALLGARFVGPAGRVYAFEPAPESAEATRTNASLNGLANLSVVEKAVGAAAGRDRLLLVEDLSWSHLESLGSHPRAQGALEVEVVALDDLLRDGAIEPPALVKIDVEGSELAVLEGMRETIERHRPPIVCELHETSEEFVATMEALGYATSNLEGKVALRDAPPSVHALAVPR